MFNTSGRNVDDSGCHLYFPNWSLSNTASGVSWGKKALCLNRLGNVT